MGWEANSCKASAPLVATRTLNPASSNNILRPSRPFHSSSTHRTRGLLGMTLLRFFAGQAREELALASFSRSSASMFRARSVPNSQSTAQESLRSEKNVGLQTLPSNDAH